jgi:hypothetical protein
MDFDEPRRPPAVVLIAILALGLAAAAVVVAG